jgi:hypothetical protein
VLKSRGSNFENRSKTCNKTSFVRKTDPDVNAKSDVIKAGFVFEMKAIAKSLRKLSLELSEDGLKIVLFK